MEEKNIENIKKIVSNTIVLTILAHGILDNLIFLDKSDHPSDFSGSYVMKNSDSSGTAVVFNIIPSIIDIDFN